MNRSDKWFGSWLLIGWLPIFAQAIIGAVYTPEKIVAGLSIATLTSVAIGLVGYIILRPRKEKRRKEKK